MTISRIPHTGSDWLIAERVTTSMGIPPKEPPDDDDEKEDEDDDTDL